MHVEKHQIAPVPVEPTVEVVVRMTSWEAEIIGCLVDHATDLLYLRDEGEQLTSDSRSVGNRFTMALNDVKIKWYSGSYAHEIRDILGNPR